MKKSLFALAALGAFATAAQAQSSVTLYGTMDASVQYIGNGGRDPSAFTSTSTTGNNTNFSTSQPTAASAFPTLVDGAISTSVWGMKGSEDLGGGSKAVFEAQSDLQVNNGGNNQNGMFRRAAYVGLGNNSFGTVYLGLKSNPLTDASGASFALGGNTVHQVRNVIGYSQTDFIKNGVQYETPNLSGFTGRLAYGMSNTIGDNTGGTVMAASAVYDKGGLRLTAAYNQANAGSNTIATTIPVGSPAGTGLPTGYSYASAANTSLLDNKGYILGAKYTLGALTASYAYAHGDQTGYNSATDARSVITGSAGVHMISLAYQTTPNLVLGANYQITTADSSLYNLQARYSLSKRTTVYAQANMVKNGAGSACYNAPGSTAVTCNATYGNYMAVNTNSGTATAANIGGYAIVNGIGGTYQTGQLPNTTETAVGVGVIHTF